MLYVRHGSRGGDGASVDDLPRTEAGKDPRPCGWERSVISTDRWGHFSLQRLSLRSEGRLARRAARGVVSGQRLAFADYAATALRNVNTVKPRGSGGEDGKRKLD